MKKELYFEFKFKDGYITTRLNQSRLDKSTFIDLVKKHGRCIDISRYVYIYIGSGYHTKHYF